MDKRRWRQPARHMACSITPLPASGSKCSSPRTLDSSQSPPQRTTFLSYLDDARGRCLFLGKFLQTPVQSESREAEIPSRQAFVVVSHTHDFFDDRAFHVGKILLSQGHFHAHDLLIALGDRNRHLRSRLAQFARQIVRRERFALAEDHGSFNDVFQLSDVPWIGVSLENRTNLWLNVQHLFAEFLPIPHKRSHAQWEDVFHSLPQWGEFEGHDVQTEKQVFTECAARHLLLEVTVGGRDKAEVYLNVV